MTTKAAILASGNGSNAQNIIEHVENHAGLEIMCVISDVKDAFVLERASRLGVDSLVIAKEKGESKLSHEKRILSCLNEREINWVFLAGYMRLLTENFIESFYDVSLDQSRIVNIHPSLLPEYPGLNSYERAYLDKSSRNGVTLHYVDSGMDTGKIIFQKEFNSENVTNLEEFKKRGFEAEFKCYTDFLDLFDSNGDFEYGK